MKTKAVEDRSAFNCIRCVTSRKCANFGCAPNTWPSEVPKRFEIRHRIFEGIPVTFTEGSAPEWLTGENTVPGSTMDCRWFWKYHVLNLGVGRSLDTEFHTITRIA